MLNVDIKKKLGDFSLSVQFETENETLALLGQSGCGKSVTLRCIAGIIRPDEGHIELNGRVLFDSGARIDLTPQKRRVGYLFQDYCLFPHMTAEQNITVAVKPRCDSNVRTAERVQVLLKQFQLETQADLKPHQLSGGQRQRAALARILGSEPELLLLDEPFSALDDYLRWQLELELADTLGAFGNSAILVSHNRDEVYRLADSVCVLSDGRAEKKHSVRELFDNPTTLSACIMSGCKNFSRIRKFSEHCVEALDWGVTLDVTAHVGDASHIGVRAHYIVPCDEGDNSFHCAVERTVDNVFSAIVMLHTPAGTEGYSRLRMELSKEKWRGLEGKKTLQVAIPPGDIMPLIEEV